MRTTKGMVQRMRKSLSLRMSRPRSRRIHDTARLWFGASAVSSCRPSDENVVLVDRPLEEVLEIESICHMAKCRGMSGTEELYILDNPWGRPALCRVANTAIPTIDGKRLPGYGPVRWTGCEGGADQTRLVIRAT